MVAGIAHESRNALQQIQSSAEMLARRIRSGESVLVGEIQKAHDRLHHLLEDVRGYAAPLKLSCEVHDLGSLWTEAWKQLVPHRRGRDVLFHEDTSGVDLHCLVDPYPIERLFLNLFENALAACGEPAEIEVRCSASELAGRSALRIQVRDNGAGLTTEQRQRIFEPFYTTKTTGTGLGMAIAKRIVEAHGGQIAVANGNGTGTAIEFCLPRGLS
jgi:signal transduction histidine kinase